MHVRSEMRPAPPHAPEEVELTPCELFGFGLGAFQQVPSTESKPLMCRLQNDAALVVRLPSDASVAKTLAPLAAACFAAERHDGVTGVCVQSHTLRAKGTAFHRYEVVPDAEVFEFTPKDVALPEAGDNGAAPAMKAAEFGAALLQGGGILERERPGEGRMGDDFRLHAAAVVQF